MLYRVDGCNEPTYQDRGDVRSCDGSLGCDDIASVYFNSRDTVLANARKVLDALIFEVRQGYEVGDTFVSKAKYRSI